MATLIKVGCLLVGALLFLIGAFSDTNWPEMFGIAGALLAVGLCAEELPGVAKTYGDRTPRT